MKYKHVIPAILLASFVSLAFMPNAVETFADPVYEEVIYNWQSSHLRLHHDGDMNTDYPGTYWNYDEFNGFDELDTSYFRIPLQASAEGDYDFKFKYVGASYHIRYYLNDALPVDQTLPGGWNQYNDATLNLHLKNGFNALIIQVRDWGGISSYSLPDGVSLIHSNEQGVNYFDEGFNNGPRLYGDVLNENSHFFVGPFRYDTDDSYNSKSSVLFKTLEDTRSLDLTYKLIKNATDGNPTIGLRVNNGATNTIYLTEKSLNEEHKINIAQSDLIFMGFDFTKDAINKVEFVSLDDNSSECILLSKVESSTNGSEAPEGYRIEAEDTKIYGRHVVRTSIEDWEAWSNGAYVGNTGPEQAITKPEQISFDGSNVKIFELNVNVNRGGMYAIRVSYASSMSNPSKVYFKNSKDSSYKSIPLSSTGGWATPCSFSSEMLVSLGQGQNTVYITGPTTDGSWANYDYFQIYSVTDTNNVYINVVPNELCNVFGLQPYYPKGSRIEFKVELTEYASNFTGTYHVFANETELVLTNGWYVVANAQENLDISVRGIEANVWHIYYYDGETLVHTDTYHVGEQVTAYKLNNRYHLRFDGWNKGVPNFMPNEDLTFYANFVEDESVGNLPGWAIALIIAVPSTLILAGAGVGVFFIVKAVVKKRKVA